MVRETLKRARKDNDMTQQTIANHLRISLRYYQQIEAGQRNGDFELWDSMEDLFLIHQRKLREITKTCPVPKGNR